MELPLLIAKKILRSFVNFSDTVFYELIETTLSGFQSLLVRLYEWKHTKFSDLSQYVVRNFFPSYRYPRATNFNRCASDKGFISFSKSEVDFLMLHRE